jgi:hypothetical protein
MPNRGRPRQYAKAFLATVGARWERLDPAEYPFVRRLAAQLPGHDDRQQFLAGLDLILAGIKTIAAPQRS